MFVCAVGSALLGNSQELENFEHVRKEMQESECKPFTLVRK